MNSRYMYQSRQLNYATKISGNFTLNIDHSNANCWAVFFLVVLFIICALQVGYNIFWMKPESVNDHQYNHKCTFLCFFFVYMLIVINIYYMYCLQIHTLAALHRLHLKGKKTDVNLSAYSLLKSLSLASLLPLKAPPISPLSSFTKPWSLLLKSKFIARTVKRKKKKEKHREN